jgi:hypothetical protein
MRDIVRFFLVACGVVACVLALVSEDVEAMPPAALPSSCAVTCVPPNAFNPDAGLGLVYCGSGDVAVSAENESATAVYFGWRRTAADNRPGLTKANYTTAGKKRCNGCAGGIGYSAEIASARTDLFCIAGTSTDAGIVVAVETAR